MKPLSPAAESRRFAPVAVLLWLLDLIGPGLVLRVANRAALFDGIEFLPLLAGAPEWSMEPHGDFGPGGLVVTRASVHLADDASLSPPLRESLLRAPLSEFSATLRLAWLDAAGSADPEDAVTFLHGAPVALRREPGALVLDLVDDLTARAARPVLRDFAALAASDPALSASLVQRVSLPLVFGVHDRLPLASFVPGAQARLAAPLAVDDPQAFLDSLDGFPASGVAQIGGELVQYDAVDTAALALGTVADPLVRLDTPEPHASGSLVRARPAGGFAWLVADHPCASVSDPEAGGLPIPPGTWSADLLDLAGVDVQLLRLDRFPSGAVTARVEGWPLAGGAPAVNPADLLEILLTHERFAALDPARLDAASFAAARAALASLVHSFARVIASPSALLVQLDSAAREAACWLRSGPARISLHRAGPVPPLAAVALLDDDTALDPLRPAAAEPEPVPLPRDLMLDRAGADPALPGASMLPFLLEFDDLPAPSPSEIRPPLLRRLDWLDGRSAPALEDFARRLAPWIAAPVSAASQRFLIAHAPLEPGDPVAASRPPLGLAFDPLWLSFVRTDGPASVELGLRGPLAAPARFASGSGSFVRVFGAGRRLAAAAGGEVQLRLSRLGHLKLAGELVEDAALPPGPLDESIALHAGPPADGALVFACGEAPAFTPFLLLAPDGAGLGIGAGAAMGLAGVVVELGPSPAAPPGFVPPDLPLPPPLGPACYETDASAATFAPHPESTAAYFDVAAAELLLAADLIEGVPLDVS